MERVEDLRCLNLLGGEIALAQRRVAEVDER
jgi:hypothetical protein